MSNSANIPALGNKIVVDIPALNALLRQMIQAELTNVTDLPTRAKQLVEGSSGWEVQQYNGSAWVTLEDWNINAQKVDGFSASQSATANAIAVRDKNGALPGNLTGNAATASKAAALSAVNPVAMGGTGATTAEGARDNLGVTSLLSTINTNIAAKAPTSHASSATTYGAASASNYGHAKASGTTPKAHGTAAVGSETATFARGDHVHPAQTTVSGNAGSATKLATARTFRTNLASTRTASFDGTANVTPGVTGVLPVANGGTGKNSGNIVYSVNGTTANAAGNVALGTELPTGSVIAFAGNPSSAPSGFLLCNGAKVSRTTYAALYSAIGTKYGTGDGSTTFTLPNLTDKFIQGSGTAGTVKAAGLPNITGSSQWWGAVAQSASGAFTTSGTAITYTRDYTYDGGVLGFDASKSNAIYGASTTVQPPALTMRYYIKY